MSDEKTDGETPLSEANPEALLRRFAEKWNVDDSVADATITETHEETAVRHEHTAVHVAESVDADDVLPASTYRDAVDERRPLADRYAEVSKQNDGPVKFVEYGKDAQTCKTCSGTKSVTCGGCGGEGRHTCPRCRGSLTQTCNTCRGSGSNSCTRCHGSGTVGHGEDESQCAKCRGSGKTQCGTCDGGGSHTCEKCGGNGDVQCSDCRGSGQVTCGTCRGDGHVVVATHGEIEVTHETDVTYNTEHVPSKHVPSSGGTYKGTTVKTAENEPAVGGESTYHHEIEKYAIPARTIEYEYDGDEYKFYQVLESLSADTYPKSIARRVAAILGVGAVAGAVVALAWHLGYITF